MNPRPLSTHWTRVLRGAVEKEHIKRDTHRREILMLLQEDLGGGGVNYGKSEYGSGRLGRGWRDAIRKGKSGVGGGIGRDKERKGKG